MSITISSPHKSPMLNEYEEATVTDENGNVLPVICLAPLDSSGHSGVASNLVTAVPNSQVTGRVQAPLVNVPGGKSMQLKALVTLDGSGNPIPFVAGSAAVVNGKFQSGVVVATGSSQNVAHTLGVVPSLVHIAPVDNTASGSTPFTFQITEGTHTNANIVFTGTSGLKVKIIAFA